MPSAASADPPLTEHTVYLLSQLGRAGRRVLTRELAAHQMTMRDMAALAVLEQSGVMSQAELGRRLGLDPSDVTTLVDEMAGSGRVERTVDAGDRRRRLVRVTPGGISVLVTARAVTRRVDAVVLAPLPAARRRELHEVLVELLVHARAV